MENENWSEQMIELLNGLTDEQKEKINACKGQKEILACLGEMGVELPDEMLDAVAGGQEEIPPDVLELLQAYEWLELIRLENDLIRQRQIDEYDLEGLAKAHRDASEILMAQGKMKYTNEYPSQA